MAKRKCTPKPKPTPCPRCRGTGKIGPVTMNADFIEAVWLLKEDPDGYIRRSSWNARVAWVLDGDSVLQEVWEDDDPSCVDVTAEQVLASNWEFWTQCPFPGE